jgi:hypothetical protein
MKQDNEANFDLYNYTPRRHIQISKVVAAYKNRENTSKEEYIQMYDSKYNITSTLNYNGDTLTIRQGFPQKIRQLTILQQHYVIQHTDYPTLIKARKKALERFPIDQYKSPQTIKQRYNKNLQFEAEQENYLITQEKNKQEEEKMLKSQFKMYSTAHVKSSNNQDEEKQ